MKCLYATVRDHLCPDCLGVGLICTLGKPEDYLEDSSFINNEELDYRKLRKKYSKKILSKEEKEAIQSKRSSYSEAGLMKRGYGEEKFPHH